MRQHVCNMRGLILRTATMVSIDSHIHQATRTPSILATVECHTLPKSMVKSEADHVDEAYFVLDFSLHTCLQQLTRVMAWLTSFIRYSGLNPLMWMYSVLQLPNHLGRPQYHFIDGTKAKPSGNIHLSPGKARGRKANTSMNHVTPEHILIMCNVSMPDLL
jgi:hypothetical protein